MQKIAIFIPKVIAMSNVDHKKAVREVLVMGALMGVAVAMEWAFGPFPLAILRFPLNVILMALWLVLLVELYRRRAKSPLAQALLSQRATVTSLLLMADRKSVV